MRVLVTRPLEDAQETAALLQTRGHEALVAPLLTVKFHGGPRIDLTGVQAVLATSANGVRAISRRTAQRDLPLFAVGPQTAQAALNEGFKLVRSADGDAAALAQAVPEWAAAENGALLHASGAQEEGGLAKALTATGFTVQTVRLYEVDAVKSLPPAVCDALAGGALDAVMLFSPRSARIFGECVVNAGLASAASRLIGVCISQAAAAALEPLNLLDIRIARHPNQASLLDCLG